MTTNSPLFVSTSSEKPSLLTISFASDPSGSLGVQLMKCDTGSTTEMFVPSYAVVEKLLEGDTVARRAGVKMGDCIVAINKEGYRRFLPDFADDELEQLSPDDNTTTLTEDEKKLKSKVLTGLPTGEAYNVVLAKIKEIKSAADPLNPLLLSLERHGWDARANAWPRFLAARDGHVPTAMMMMQAHEAWNEKRFPIDLTEPSIQSILKLRAISEIDVGLHTVYVNYGKLQSLNVEQSPEDVVTAFVIATEIVLGKCDDPRAPKSCQLIDLTGVSITSGFRVDILKKIYAAFEPNYPETLTKMIMYPISRTVSYLAKTLLSFVNEKTKKKFILTDSLDKVCEELGWDKAAVEAAGGISGFATLNDTSGGYLIFE